MTARRLAFLRLALAIAHVLLGAVLLLPIAMIVGLGSLQALVKLPFSLMLLAIVITAFPMWILLSGLGIFWRLTPRTTRALKVADSIVTGGALLLFAYGLMVFRAAERSAAGGGGLLGGYGVIPIALGIFIGGLAVASLWLLRLTSRTTLERGRAKMKHAPGIQSD